MGRKSGVGGGGVVKGRGRGLKHVMLRKSQYWIVPVKYNEVVLDCKLILLGVLLLLLFKQWRLLAKGTA